MNRHFRFEILSLLFNTSQNMADILPLIQSMTNNKTLPRIRVALLLANMQKDGVIDYIDYGDEIKASLLPAGISEYRLLRRTRAAREK